MSRDWSHIDIIGMKLRKQWPPEKRCENCRRWSRPWWFRWFGPKRLGQCVMLRERTWRSYTCPSWGERFDIRKEQ